MKENLKNYILIVLVIFALVLAMLSYFRKPSIACVQLAKVYESFELKKELELKYKNATAARKRVSDSLELQLKVLSNMIDQLGEKDALRNQKIEQFEYKRQEFFSIQKRNTEDNAALTKMYEEQIWTQINQYVQDYGKEQGYSCILGANGSGSLMYSDDKIDITDQIIKTVNSKFKTGNAK